MSDISKINDEIRQQARSNNPILARRTVIFAFLCIVLNLTAWVGNAGVLLFSLLATDMIWPIALIVFCCIWLVILGATKLIMVPMGRRLALQHHEEVLKVISGICDRAGRKT